MTSCQPASGYTLDPSYRRPNSGRVVIAGSPLKLFRLGEGGVRVAESLERDDALSSGHEALTDRLVDAGAIHPRIRMDRDARHDPGVLTIVIPARDELPIVRPQRCAAVLIDDGSKVPLTVADGVMPLLRLFRIADNRGPGGARNAGLAHVDTEFVAFVDNDVAVDEDDLLSLLGHFDDPRVALVAPRIASTPGPSCIARYETDRSPLDLGGEPARVAPTTRVSYVPAAVIICRVTAMRELGGFDESLRYGEDVDLVWRLVGAGWRCRYEPAVTALHRSRPTWHLWWMQRFHYGTSAAPLSRRHPGTLAPVRMSGWSCATWAGVGFGHPLAGVGVGLGTAIALVHKLRDVPARDTLRLAGTGHLFAGRLVASTVVRAWWPISVLLALVSRRARRILLASWLATTAWDSSKHGGRLDPLRAALIRTADDLAYGSGIWAGMLRERTLAPILPRFTSWPGSNRDSRS